MRPFGEGCLFPAPAPGEAAHRFRQGRMVVTGPRDRRLVAGVLMLVGSFLMVALASVALILDQGEGLLIGIALGVGILLLPAGFLMMATPPWRIEAGAAGIRVARGGIGSGRLIPPEDIAEVLVVPDILLDIQGYEEARIEEARIGVLLHSGFSIGFYATQLPWEVQGVAGSLAALLRTHTRTLPARPPGEVLPGDPPPLGGAARLRRALQRQAELHLPANP